MNTNIESASIAAATDPAEEFERHRRHLRSLAYRMLGSRAEAEDAVQDTWLRWAAVDRGAIDNPRAFLSRTITNLCLDRIKSAHMQKEIYIGVWLPEPLVDDYTEFQPGPETMHELAHDLSYAFLLTLEKLSPLERAAFLLHDIFDMSFADVAATLGRSEAACRQLAARARANVRADRPAVSLPQEQERKLAGAFINAIRDGDIAGLASVLAQDATFSSDGGGRATAVPRVLAGRDKIAKALVGFGRLHARASLVTRPARINGLPGFVISASNGQVVQTTALEITRDGLIGAIYIVRNPDKLQNIRP
jgi:RNA polymerase sigma-70 factor (ECF subfamily)